MLKYAVSYLPITPLHYPVAKILHHFGPMSLSLPALIVGAFTPDLEVPVITYLTGGAIDRLVLHSIIGGLTFGVLIAVAITVLLYPVIVGAVLPVNKESLGHKCRLSGMVVFSCIIGVLFHIILDVANHTFNPLFWPFRGLYQTHSPIVYFLGGPIRASFFMHGLMLFLSAVIAVALLLNRKDSFWNQLLVG